LSVALSGLARLTRVEYQRTVTAILGAALVAEVNFDNLPADGKTGQFENNTDLNVNIDIVDAYRMVAEDMGEQARVNATTLLGCEESPTCVDTFIRTYGERIYRRPLSVDEVDRFLAFWNTARSEGDLGDAMRLIIAAFFQMPDFLYRLEKGEDSDTNDVRRLTAYELASRLSFFLWKSGPDEQLLAAAANGELDTPDGIGTQVQRILQDPRADYAILRFHASWLGLTALETQVVDTEAFPQYEQLRDDMVDETEQFVLHLFRDGDAQVRTLFTADYSFATPELAAFYGEGASSVANDGRIVLDPQQRRGILTHASYLTAHAKTPSRAAIYRGKSILVDVFCKSLALPDNVDTAIDFDPTRSAREQIEEATSAPACSGCHGMINPLGFLFENYDGIGRWRTMDGAYPVDASGALNGTDVDGPLVGATELMAKLAESKEVADCMSRQWLRFALSRLDGGLDEGSIVSASDEAQGDMRTLIVALTRTDAFRHRRVAE